MKKLSILILLALCTVGCNSKRARINGQFADRANTAVYLEIITPGRSAIVDSTTTNGKGDFRFNIKLADQDPTIYNIRTGKEFIPLIVAPGENIALSSVGILSQNYQVSGSPESEAVQQISTLLTNGAADLTDISKNYMNSSDEAERKQLTADYLKKYYAIKRSHIEFVVRNATMLAGIYALYQRLPGDEVLFNGDGDIVYYRMVADSVSRTYPTSKYLAALQNEVSTADGTQKLTNELAEKMASPVGFPPITLPNIYGQKVELAEVVAANKATLVYFWKSDLKDAAVQNAELKTIYNEYKELGFEIYQIALDTSKPSWVAAVQNQQLPWINLCDFRGAACPAYTAYNITSLPSTFLIDTDGDLVGKDLFGGALVNKLNQMLQ